MLIVEVPKFLDRSFSNCGDFQVPVLIKSADAIELTSRQEVRFRQTCLSKKVLYKMLLVLDIFGHIGQILQPLDLGKFEKSKTKICPGYRTG